MTCPRLLRFTVLFAAGAIARAEPEAEVRAAATALARTSHAWETTARQRFTSESRDFRPNPNATIEVRGRTDPEGSTQITVLPSPDIPVEIVAVFRAGDVVGQTPVGWLRRTAMRQVPNQDRTIQAGGRPVRLSRLLAAALQVTARKTAAEDLLDLIEEVKAWREQGGLVLGALSDRAIERLWGDAQAKRAPEVHGTVIFRPTAAGLTEYHVVLAIGFPQSRTGKTAWTMLQWSTRFSGLGSTQVEPPAAALKALDEDGPP